MISLCYCEHCGEPASVRLEEYCDEYYVIHSPTDTVKKVTDGYFCLSCQEQLEGLVPPTWIVVGPFDLF